MDLANKRAPSADAAPPFERDPAKRPPIWTLPVSLRENYQRKYLTLGAHRVEHDGARNADGRRFLKSWFSNYDWLEYSDADDSAYCLYCFVMSSCELQCAQDAFVTRGFTSWGKVGGKDCKLLKHNESHRHKVNFDKVKLFLRPELSVASSLVALSKQQQEDNKKRLNVTIDAVRFLINQNLAFRGHDESSHSDNRGNFLELTGLLFKYHDPIATAPGNNSYSSPEVQKGICQAIHELVLEKIYDEVKSAKFCLMIDETADESGKEQMTFVIRFVTESGHVVERFLGMITVPETSAATLYNATRRFLLSHRLQISQIRGQGYDGAANMKGEHKGLRTLIQKDSPTAFYVHCFNHQLQLALVDLASQHAVVWQFFSTLSAVVTCVTSSTKRMEELREAHKEQTAAHPTAGKGANQHSALPKACDTRWSSHYNSVCSLLLMFDAVVEVIQTVSTDGTPKQRGEAHGLLQSISTFDFIFTLHLAEKFLGITHCLSQALQRRDSDIVNAVSLIQLTKDKLAKFRHEGWPSLHDAVTKFCQARSLSVPEMIAIRPTLRAKACVTQEHHYKIDIFYSVLDNQLSFLNDRFSEMSTKLLQCAACFDPANKMEAFDLDDAMKLAALYVDDFDDLDLKELEHELPLLVEDCRSTVMLQDSQNLAQLCIALNSLKKHQTYPKAYKLICLILTLPVSSASAERSFSALKLTKSRLRTKISQEWLNSLLVPSIEAQLGKQLSNDSIITRYMALSPRRAVFS
jgi:hypothetical protein